jgi:hypothetical protein
MILIIISLFACSLQTPPPLPQYYGNNKPTQGSRRGGVGQTAVAGLCCQPVTSRTLSF